MPKLSHCNLYGCVLADVFLANAWTSVPRLSSTGLKFCIAERIEITESAHGTLSGQGCD